MEDKKVISVRKLAVIERAKALGIPLNKPETSELERQAREWKGREEAKRLKTNLKRRTFRVICRRRKA